MRDLKSVQTQRTYDTLCIKTQTRQKGGLIFLFCIKIKGEKTKGGKITQGQQPSVAHSAAKQKNKKRQRGGNSSLVFRLIMWEIWSAKGSPLYVYLLKRSICCGFACKRNGEAFFFLPPMPFCTGPVGASLLCCSLMRRRRREGGQRGGKKEDGRMGGGKEEGEGGHERLREGFVLLIVAAEVASVSGFISA